MKIKAKIRQLKIEQKETKKENLSANEYLSKIKGVVHAIAIVGYPIFESDHVEIILDGLPEPYDPFVMGLTTTSTTNKETYSPDDAEALILAKEATIENNDKIFEPQNPNLSHHKNSHCSNFSSCGHCDNRGRGGRDN